MSGTYKTLALTAVLAATTALSAFAPTQARAEDEIYVPLFTYRTGPFSGSGIPIANGMHDYLRLLNERDGGIGGVKLRVEECETGYDAKKGVECYEAVKGKGPVVVNPWSTGTTLSLIPKAGVDKVPVLSMAYGLSASADGQTFPWIFNPPNTYWDGASMILSYIGSQEGGLEKLKGKKIGYIYLDAGFGKEPIPLLESLSKEIGFDLKLYPVPADNIQNQSSQWLSVRRDKPDYMVLFGWGALNPTAVKEAVKINYPMDKFVSIWWPGEDDVRSAGPGAKGFKTLNWHGVGANFPALDDIKKHLVDAGKSKTDKNKVGDVLYNRGVYNSLLIAEGIANAQKITGKKVVTGEDVRRGLEAINITPERLKELGLEGFAEPLKLSCTDHNGHKATFLQEWDGEKWVRATDLVEPLHDRVEPLLKAAAKEYAEKNSGWPKRTEACDAPA
ncbi:branched-chain amino acid transport system substrate-binding protein [Pseudochelatococcus lubricantis]|uniref:Branched-chain amino acid transport system substrate-binding protein n=1 Tax=Pseudochelatococcus lubricantis TaxID=1538102 RepID=A0ABX0UYG3_9HYPH|nr:ABC transporter substrate-binding protein [Pseudochelatococcus lubricantis]NIJ56960.1 branched-chain amino acid transport system substrate-binding protein [Pseudochelatococcus lubricantis]